MYSLLLLTVIVTVLLQPVAASSPFVDFTMSDTPLDGSYRDIDDVLCELCCLPFFQCIHAIVRLLLPSLVALLTLPATSPIRPRENVLQRPQALRHDTIRLWPDATRPLAHPRICRRRLQAAVDRRACPNHGCERDNGSTIYCASARRRYLYTRRSLVCTTQPEVNTQATSTSPWWFPLQQGRLQ